MSGQKGDARQAPRHVAADRAAKLAELQQLIGAGVGSGLSCRTPHEIRPLGRERLAAARRGS